VAPCRRYSRGAYFKRDEVARLVREALGDARKPLEAGEIAAAIIAAKGFPDAAHLPVTKMIVARLGAMTARRDREGPHDTQRHIGGRERAKLNGVLRPSAHLSRIHLASPSEGFVATPKAVGFSFGCVERDTTFAKVSGLHRPRGPISWAC
jgi:hypothetical protein